MRQSLVEVQAIPKIPFQETKANTHKPCKVYFDKSLLKYVPIEKKKMESIYMDSKESLFERIPDLSSPEKIKEIQRENQKILFEKENFLSYLQFDFQNDTSLSEDLYDAMKGVNIGDSFANVMKEIPIYTREKEKQIKNVQKVCNARQYGPLLHILLFLTPYEILNTLLLVCRDFHFIAMYIFRKKLISLEISHLFELFSLRTRRVMCLNEKSSILCFPIFNPRKKIGESFVHPIENGKRMRYTFLKFAISRGYFELFKILLEEYKLGPPSKLDFKQCIGETKGNFVMYMLKRYNFSLINADISRILESVIKSLDVESVIEAIDTLKGKIEKKKTYSSKHEEAFLFLLKKKIPRDDKRSLVLFKLLDKNYYGFQISENISEVLKKNVCNYNVNFVKEVFSPKFMGEDFPVGVEECEYFVKGITSSCVMDKKEIKEIMEFLISDKSGIFDTARNCANTLLYFAETEKDIKSVDLLLKGAKEIESFPYDKVSDHSFIRQIASAKKLCENRFEYVVPINSKSMEECIFKEDFEKFKILCELVSMKSLEEEETEIIYFAMNLGFNEYYKILLKKKEYYVTEMEILLAMSMKNHELVKWLLTVGLLKDNNPVGYKKLVDNLNEIVVAGLIFPEFKYISQHLSKMTDHKFKITTDCLLNTLQDKEVSMTLLDNFNIKVGEMATMDIIECAVRNKNRDFLLKLLKMKDFDLYHLITYKNSYRDTQNKIDLLKLVPELLKLYITCSVCKKPLHLNPNIKDESASRTYQCDEYCKKTHVCYGCVTIVQTVNVNLRDSTTSYRYNKSCSKCFEKLMKDEKKRHEKEVKMFQNRSFMIGSTKKCPYNKKKYFSGDVKYFRYSIPKLNF